MDMDRISFEKLNPDGLSGVRWTFYLLHHTLVVDAYEEFARESKRHKPKTIRFWARLNQRDSQIPQNAVPLTNEIIQEAKSTFIRQIEQNVRVGFQH